MSTEWRDNSNLIIVHMFIKTYSVLSYSVVSDFSNLMDCSLAGSCLCNFPSQNTGVRCHFLRQNILCCYCCWVASVVSDSVRPHRRQPTRLPSPWDSPGKNTGVGCHFLLQCMKVKSESEVAQSCLTSSDPMDCSLPGPSVHGIFQARVLEWVAINAPLFS